MSRSSAELRKLGLKYVGFGKSCQTCSSDLSTRRFRAHNGVDSLAVKALIADLGVQGEKVDPKKLFMVMAICWFKLYELEEVMAG
jgi:hypothetical protein